MLWQQQGYIFWLERVTVIIVAAVPFNYLVGHYYYLAFGLFLVPAILSYILRPENNSKVSYFFLSSFPNFFFQLLFFLFV